MAAGYISVGDPYEDCFADDLIKMAQNHYVRQGARVTRAVKVAHMGRVMAQRQQEADLLKLAVSHNLTPEEYEMLKEAGIGAGVSKFLTGLGKTVPKAVGGAARGAARGGGKALEGIGNVAIRGAKGGAEGLGNAVIGGAKGAVKGVEGVGNVVLRGAEGLGNAVIGGAKGVGRAGQAVAGQASRAGQAVAGQATRAGQAVSRGAGRVGQAVRKTTPSPMPTTSLTRPKMMPKTPVSAPSHAGFANKPVDPSKFFGGGKAPTPSPIGGSQGAAGGVGAAGGKQPGFLRKFFGGAREGFGAEDLSALGGGGKAQRIGRQVGDVASGALGMGSSNLKNFAGQAAIGPVMAAGRGAVNVAKRGLASRGVVKNVAKAGKGAIGDAAQAASHAPSLGREALESAVSKGMSGQQLSAAEQLFQQGGNMSGRARKKLERMAGMSYDDIAQSGSLSNAMMQASPTGGAGRVAREAAEKTRRAGSGVGDIAATGAEDAAKDAISGGAEEAAGGAPGALGRVKNFLTQPLGGPKTRLAMGAAGVALPIVGGLGVYGAYHGMNRLARANQQSAFQHGTHGMPINYSPTAMFPAGQVSY